MSYAFKFIDIIIVELQCWQTSKLNYLAHLDKVKTLGNDELDKKQKQKRVKNDAFCSKI